MKYKLVIIIVLFTSVASCVQHKRVFEFSDGKKRVKVFTDLDKLHDYKDNKITSLDLSHKELNEIPKDIIRFKDLKYLNLSDNNLETLPMWLSALQKLEVLSLSGNQFVNLEGVQNLSSLKWLDLSKNKISYLPNDFVEMNRLETLIIIDNAFSLDYINNLKEQMPNCRIIAFIE